MGFDVNLISGRTFRDYEDDIVGSQTRSEMSKKLVYTLNVITLICKYC